LRSGFSLEAAGEGLPSGIGIRNYPNPFNSATTVVWESQQSGELRIVIHDITGRQVAELYHGQTGQGEGGCSWNGQSNNGNQVASGFYILSATLNGQTIHHRMLLVR
jgi:flagellar hook assembly protein FlgD